MISAISASRRSFSPSSSSSASSRMSASPPLTISSACSISFRTDLYSRAFSHERLDFGERLRVLAILVRVRLDRRGRQERRQLLVARFDGIQLIQHECSSQPPDTGGKKRDLVAVRDRGGHPRVIGVHGRRHRGLVARHLGKLGHQPLPHVATVAPAGASRDRSPVPAMSRSLANSRTVTRMRAAPLPAAPPRLPGWRSRLRSRLRRPRKIRASRSARSASRARSRSGRRRTPPRDARSRRQSRCSLRRSPGCPMRWCTASRMPGHSRSASRQICASAFTAIGSYASYSRCVTRRFRLLSRTTPMNVATAPWPPPFDTSRIRGSSSQRARASPRSEFIHASDRSAKPP